ncbi:hypothetical protein [Xanthomonas sp. 3075]|uniref:hypothetical protein n=1 Tax=Xanthomonas sp. 3075 TaxID=3035315 RepID=UPI00160B601F|nr:hypothetical protein [Xanthomonas sp. 3075]MBB4129958.1 hypothetical protein [Xanthomonas sp. 3075]
MQRCPRARLVLNAQWRDVLNGRCLAIVRAKPGARGVIIVRVESDTLHAASTQVVAE